MFRKLLYFLRGFYVKKEEASKPVQKSKEQQLSLFISAGHSDSDPGATSDGYSEADFVLEFRDMLAEELRSRGVEFSQDGERGENLPLTDAWKMASSHDIALEFHCNSFHNPSVSGVEALCDPSYSDIAGGVCQAISGSTGLRNRGVKEEGSGQHSRLAFVSDGGGIIIELFFISNPDDIKKYEDNKETTVKAVADVLEGEVGWILK